MTVHIEYFASEPLSTDKAWCQEMASVADYCHGRGLDPGAGLRTFSRDVVRVDLRHDVEPERVADARALPFPDNEFDFVVTSHLIEHLPNPQAALSEWLRVVKPGGTVSSIIPDTTFTQAMNTDHTPHLHEWSPREFLAEVFGWTGEVPWFLARPTVSWADAEVVDIGEAQPGWSFMVVLRKGANGCGR